MRRIKINRSVIWVMSRIAAMLERSLYVTLDVLANYNEGSILIQYHNESTGKSCRAEWKNNTEIYEIVAFANAVAELSAERGEKKDVESSSN